MDAQVESGLPKTPGKKRARQQQPDPDVITFDAAVAELKQIAAQADSNAWRVAQIAYHVKPEYGDKTLAKLAKAIGGYIAACTLERRRTVVRFWKEIPASPPESFAVAQELAGLKDYPERAVQIITDKPNITSSEARKAVREWKKQQQQPQQADPNSRLEANKEWFRKAVAHATEAYRDGQIVKDQLDPERREILRQAIQPNLLSVLRDGGKALIDLADYLQRLLDEASA